MTDTLTIVINFLVIVIIAVRNGIVNKNNMLKVGSEFANKLTSDKETYETRIKKLEVDNMIIKDDLISMYKTRYEMTNDEEEKQEILLKLKKYVDEE